MIPSFERTAFERWLKDEHHSGAIESMWKAWLARSLLVAPIATDAQTPVAVLRPYPDEITDEFKFVLGWPNFRCGPYAHLFRAAGHDIKPRSEDEQAFVLHWLVKLVLDHGAEWSDIAQSQLEAMRAASAPAAHQETK